MRHAFLILLLGAALVSRESRSQGARDTILFRNGDVLLGKLESIDQQSGIRWHRPDALNQFEFSPARVTQLEFGTAKGGESRPSTNMCSIHLQNGDQMQGDLVSYDGEKVSIET